jgi:hypothetical protein
MNDIIEFYDFTDGQQVQDCIVELMQAGLTRDESVKLICKHLPK